MDILKKHEIFEIEVLEKLKNSGLLNSLVFTGGTMLRLCYELNRYSTDLDFRFIKKVNQKVYFSKLSGYLENDFELTDSWIKFNTILIEIRSRDYPKRLKIEIRKEIKKCDFQETIAFSPFSNKQVILKALTLEQALKDKIEAALDRKDIRDFFDIEFILRRNVSLETNKKELFRLKKIAVNFKDKDYRVTLGSTLGAESRKYYIKNKFNYLLAKINSLVE